MNNPSYSAVIKLTQTYSPNLLNETAFLYSGNKITLTPVAGPGGGQFVKPSGWTATSFFPDANNRMNRMPEVQLQGSPLNVTWSPSYYPWKNGYEGFHYRDDVSWTKGRHQFKFGVGWLHDYKNQELQHNTNGVVALQLQQLLRRLLRQLPAGHGVSYSPAGVSVRASTGSTTTTASMPTTTGTSSAELTLNLGLRYDGLPHAFERYNKFSNFVPRTTTAPSVTRSVPDGTLDPGLAVHFLRTGSEQFYLNGIREAGVNGFPRGNVREPLQHLAAAHRLRLGHRSATAKPCCAADIGMFYERVQGNDVYNAALNPPFAYIPSANNVYFSNPNTSALTGATTLNHFPSSLTNIKYDYPPPGTANLQPGHAARSWLLPSSRCCSTWARAAGTRTTIAPDQHAAPGEHRREYSRRHDSPIAAMRPLRVRQARSHQAHCRPNRYRIFPGLPPSTRKRTRPTSTTTPAGRRSR